MSAEATIKALARDARAALPALAATPTAQKAAAIAAAATAIRARSADLLAANAADVEAARAAGISTALIDRLALDSGRIESIAVGLDTVAALEDPVGVSIKRWSQPNGLAFERVRVPLGVIGIIYESRPGVTADAAALCLMSGNACLLRGGSEAARSNAVLLECVAAGLASAGLPAAAVQIVPAGDRALVGAMLAVHGLIDVIIPRGGKGLVARVQAEARVPVLAHLDGINHVYVDASADADMAVAITVNSKLRRTAVCGAMETLLIDRAAAPDLQRAVVAALLDSGCEVRGDAGVRELDTRVMPIIADSFDTEYLDAIASAALVDGVEGAISHIARHGSAHTDAIVAEDESVAARFLAALDCAIVLWNASTQFADGGEFGFGAEIGIATGRLHARGPVGLEELTTYKTLVHRHRPGPRLKKIGLLGGSFNPAHAGHRHISVEALDLLGLDEIWWLVSPQNPLKSAAGMAPLGARLASAEAVARHPRIKVMAIEAQLRTRFAVDTVTALQHRLPDRRFIWVMGADILPELHRWHRWRVLLHRLPIAVLARPRYMGAALRAPAMAWARRWRHRPATAGDWTRWTLPAIVVLDIRANPQSATAIRAADPGWARRFTNTDGRSDDA